MRAHTARTRRRSGSTSSSLSRAWRRDKIVAFNPASRPFDGLVTHEAWLADGDTSAVAVVDEEGRDVPLQSVDSQALVPGRMWILMRLSVPARGSRILRLVSADSRTGNPSSTPSDAIPCVECGRLSNRFLEARVGAEMIEVAGWTLRMEVMEDATDTWSHSAGNRFDGSKVGDVTWSGNGEVVERGPLRAGLRLQGTYRQSRIWCRMMLAGGEPMLRLRIAVDWAQVRQRLRLRVEAPCPLRERTDLVSGGPLARPIDGLEYPLGGGLVVQGDSGALAVVAPDIFSVAVDPDSINLTLLRSPYAAHHDVVPDSEMRPDQPVTDQGRHEFDLCVWPGGEMAALKQVVEDLLIRPATWDLTG